MGTDNVNEEIDASLSVGQEANSTTINTVTISHSSY
jgi:hypothetical protein